MQLRKIWKWLGLAGVVGVAATGVVIARDQRQRSQLTPDDVRTRLHRRLENGRLEDGRLEEGRAADGGA